MPRPDIHIIVSILPNTLFMHIRHTKTAKEYFDILKGMFKTCSPVIGIELRQQLNELKLKDNGDARMHVNKVIALRKELASLRSPISDLDLFNTFLASLPQAYNNVISSVSAATQLHSKTVSVNTLFDMVIDEYDRLVLQDPSKIKTKSEDGAFNADISKKGKGKKKCFEGNCNNCGQFGHQDTDCWDEGEGKEGQAPKGWKSCGKKAKDSNSKDLDQSGKGKQSSAKANTTEAETKEPDGVWFAEPVESEALVSNAKPADSWSVCGNSDEEDLTSLSLPYATLVQDNSAASNEITELYNSSASQHMLSACVHFVDFTTIPPKPIQSVDNQTFNAIGKGNLYVHLPNCNQQSRILLKDILYALSMKVTLISISCLASTGYAALFRSQSCSIYTSWKHCKTTNLFGRLCVWICGHDRLDPRGL